MARTKRVESDRELEREVDDFKTRGFKIKKQTNKSAKVKDKDWGDMPIHGFVFIFTLVAAAVLLGMANLSSGGAWLFAIIANIIYAAYSWFNANEVVIKVDPDHN